MSLKKYKKIILLFSLGVFFVLSFLLDQAVLKVEAADCTSGCDLNGSSECIWDWGLALDNLLADRKTCAVGAIYEDVWDLGDGWNTTCTSGGGAKTCETEKCPASTVNGAACVIIEPSGSILTGCVKNEISGKWDINGNKCVLCSGQKEGGANTLCGDTTQLWTDGSGNCTGTGDSLCESACGASTQCDEQSVGYSSGGYECSTSCQWVATVTPTTTPTSTITPTPTGVVCPTLAPADGCFSPGAKGENRYDPLTGGCKVFPVPCQLAYFCENGVCKEPKSVFAMLTDGASFLASLLIGLALLVLVFGAIRYILAGITSETETAKKIILYAILGLIIGGASYAIISTIYSILKK